MSPQATKSRVPEKENVRIVSLCGHSSRLRHSRGIDPSGKIMGTIIEQLSHRSGGRSRSLDPIQDGLPGCTGHMDDGWNHQVRRDGFERAQV